MNNSIDTKDLITLAGVYSAHVGISEATLSNKLGSHARLFSRLRDGMGCTLKTATNAVTWFGENWPADLEWPKDIPRPKLNKKDAA